MNRVCESEEDQNLSESVAKLGRLVPIIKDAHGNIVDGEHRKALDAKWEEEFSIKLDNITNPIQLLIARMNINLVRRSVSPEEKTQWLKQLKELTGWSPKEIAENIGMSERWVYQYLPQEMKEPVPIGLKTESAGLAPEKIPEIEKEAQTEEKELSVPVLCSAGCGLYTKFPKYWQGQPVDSVCYDKLSRGEITLEKPKPSVGEAPKPPARVEKHVYEPGAWKDRMEQPVSRMDEFVHLELQRKGLPVRFQEPICIKSVIPDVIIEKGDKPLAVFIDGAEVHAKRTLVDMENRELLAKRGFKVLELQYDAYTEEQRQLIISEILSAIE